MPKGTRDEFKNLVEELGSSTDSLVDITWYENVGEKITEEIGWSFWLGCPDVTNAKIKLEGKFLEEPGRFIKLEIPDQWEALL